MTTEQQRKILEAAAKACGLVYIGRNQYSDVLGILVQDTYLGSKWFSPISHPADCAEMCAKLALDTAWGVDDVIVMVPEEEAHEAQYKDHNNSRLKAWMYAATMVAAKIGGYTE